MISITLGFDTIVGILELSNKSNINFYIKKNWIFGVKVLTFRF